LSAKKETKKLLLLQASDTFVLVIQVLQPQTNCKRTKKGYRLMLNRKLMLHS